MTDIAKEQSKLHGKALSDAVKAEHVDAVPGSDSAHAHSHAAHLQAAGEVHTTPGEHFPAGQAPGAIRQPPQDPQRNGKSHHRQ